MKPSSPWTGLWFVVEWVAGITFALTLPSDRWLSVGRKVACCLAVIVWGTLLRLNGIRIGKLEKGK